MRGQVPKHIAIRFGQCHEPAEGFVHLYQRSQCWIRVLAVCGPTTLSLVIKLPTLLLQRAPFRVQLTPLALPLGFSGDATTFERGEQLALLLKLATLGFELVGKTSEITRRLAFRGGLASNAYRVGDGRIRCPIAWPRRR